MAFEDLLDRGEHLADRLIGAFSDARPWAQLVHIATDGETYGHHHHYGEMALSYALQYIQENNLAKLTNYGEFLDRQPPVIEAQIHREHLLELRPWHRAVAQQLRLQHRRRRPAGTSNGAQPLREALDWLRDAVAPFFEQRGRELLTDPWAARDDYIEVILDRSPEVRGLSSAGMRRTQLDGRERIAALKLLEMQRHAMLMYTSCGWFFSELSGIETVQVIQYAGRVMQLAKQLGGPDLEPGFLERIERANSNLPEHSDGRVIYEKFVRPAMVDLEKVGGHYAVSSIFQNGSQTGRIYSYSVKSEDYRLLTAGKARLALGKAKITSEVTLDSIKLTFAVAHIGDHHVSGGVREYRDEALYAAAAEELTSVFLQGDFAQLIRVVDREFEPGTYSLARLFRDEQRKIVREILESSLGDADAAYRQIYQGHVSLMRFLASIGMHPPKRLEMAAEVTLNSDLREELEKDELDLGRIAALVEEAQIAKIAFDAPTLEFAIRKTLERKAECLSAEPRDLSLLEKLDAAVEMAMALPFEVVLWRVQNMYYNQVLTAYEEFRTAAGNDDYATNAWVERFRALGTKLSVRVE